jgi:hypothetical protein
MRKVWIEAALNGAWSRTWQPGIGHIRVGLEDAPFGTQATNLALVEEAVRMVRENGAEPATPAEMGLALAKLASTSSAKAAT